MVDPFSLAISTLSLAIARSTTRPQQPPTGSVGDGSGTSPRLASSGLVAVVLDGGKDGLR